MATTSISITPQFGNNTVAAIHCGTSSPRLSGTVDISAFPNLQQFRCEQNNITNISGYGNNIINTLQIQTNLLSGSFLDLTGLNQVEILWIYNNKYNGSFPADFANLTNLQNFRCEANSLTGSIPSLSAFPSLRFFACQNQQGATKLTGSIPVLTGCPILQEFQCHTNQLGGSLPALSGLNNLQMFRCFTQSVNGITGTIPVLNNPALTDFRIENNLLTGTIPSLNDIPNIEIFSCFQNRLTGSIPSLSALIYLKTFWCFNQLAATKLTSFDGGSVSNTLEDFRADSNQLNQSSINAILSAFVVANRTTGTRILNVGGVGNAAPSYTGGTTTTSAGTNFTRSGTLVTANVTGHGHVTGNIVTITGLFSTTSGAATAFQGTFVVTRITDNQFRYTTISSGAATGAGTATMRKTSDATSGYASYQNLALVSRTGGPWTISINQP